MELLFLLIIMYSRETMIINLILKVVLSVRDQMQLQLQIVSRIGIDRMFLFKSAVGIRLALI